MENILVRIKSFYVDFLSGRYNLKVSYSSSFQTNFAALSTHSMVVDFHHDDMLVCLVFQHTTPQYCQIVDLTLLFSNNSSGYPPTIITPTPSLLICLLQFHLNQKLNQPLFLSVSLVKYITTPGHHLDSKLDP